MDTGLLKALTAQQLRLLREHLSGQLSEVMTYLSFAEDEERARAERRARIDAMIAARRPAKTERDIEIMRLARRGWSNTEIAARLELHPNTVSRVIRRELRR